MAEQDQQHAGREKELIEPIALGELQEKTSFFPTPKQLIKTGIGLFTLLLLLSS